MIGGRADGHTKFIAVRNVPAQKKRSLYLPHWRAHRVSIRSIYGDLITADCIQRIGARVFWRRPVFTVSGEFHHQVLPLALPAELTHMSPTLPKPHYHR